MARRKTYWLIGLTVSLVLIAFALPVNALDESLLLYLTFDVDTGGVVRDMTGKTKGGKIIGGTKIITSGAHSRALELNGTSGYVEIELSPEMIEAERDSFTAELWMQTRAQGIPEAGQWFIGLGIFGGFGPKDHFQGHWTLFLLENDVLQFNVVNASQHSNDGRDGVLIEKPVVNDGTWHHVVAVRDEDNKQIRVYIDGNLAGEALDITRALNSKPDDAKARRKIWLGNHLEVFWSVRFDEVRFWNRALSADEIAKNMKWFSVGALDKLSLTWGEIKAHHKNSGLW